MTWVKTNVQERGSGGHAPENLKLYIKIPAFWALLRVLEASEEGACAPFAAL